MCEHNTFSSLSIVHFISIWVALQINSHFPEGRLQETEAIIDLLLLPPTRHYKHDSVFPPPVIESGSSDDRKLIIVSNLPHLIYQRKRRVKTMSKETVTKLDTKL